MDAGSVRMMLINGSQRCVLSGQPGICRRGILACHCRNLEVSSECHVPAHREARGMSSNKQRSSQFDLTDPDRYFWLSGYLGKSRAPRMQACVPPGRSHCSLQGLDPRMPSNVCFAWLRTETLKRLMPPSSQQPSRLSRCVTVRLLGLLLVGSTHGL